uniref:RRM domain-containing protein n=1 Tax=Oryza meridionalis TaxID=40149 RepID=A0A0E0BXJ2_9ORYZ
MSGSYGSDDYRGGYGGRGGGGGGRGRGGGGGGGGGYGGGGVGGGYGGGGGGYGGGGGGYGGGGRGGGGGGGYGGGGGGGRGGLNATSVEHLLLLEVEVEVEGIINLVEGVEATIVVVAILVLEVAVATTEVEEITTLVAVVVALEGEEEEEVTIEVVAMIVDLMTTVVAGVVMGEETKGTTKGETKVVMTLVAMDKFLLKVLLPMVGLVVTMQHLQAPMEAIMHTIQILQCHLLVAMVVVQVHIHQVMVHHLRTRHIAVVLQVAKVAYLLHMMVGMVVGLCLGVEALVHLHPIMVVVVVVVAAAVAADTLAVLLQSQLQRIYISNLPPDVTVEELQELFGGIGQVGRIKQKRGYKDQWPWNIKIYTDDSGKNKGDACLAYEDPSAAHSAGGFYNNYEMRGYKISVAMAEKSAPRAPAYEVDVVAMVEVAGITSEMEEAMGLTGIKVVVRIAAIRGIVIVRFPESGELLVLVLVDHPPLQLLQEPVLIRELIHVLLGLDCLTLFTCLLPLWLFRLLRGFPPLLYLWP